MTAGRPFAIAAALGLGGCGPETAALGGGETSGVIDDTGANEGSGETGGADTGEPLEWTFAGDFGEALAVAVDGTGHVVAAGYVTEDAQSAERHLWFARLDPAGVLLWERTLDGVDPYGDDRGHGVAIASDGRIAIAGRLGRDAWLTVVSDAGVQAWTDRLVADFGVSFRAVAFDDGDLVVVGVETVDVVYRGAFAIGGRERPAEGVPAPYDIDQALVRRYDSAGVLRWARTHRPPDPGIEAAQAVAIAADHVALVAGFDAPSFDGFTDLRVRAWDRDGVELWTEGFADTGDDVATGIASASDGGFVVVGSSHDVEFTRRGWARRYQVDRTIVLESTFVAGQWSTVHEGVSLAGADLLVAGTEHGPAPTYAHAYLLALDRDGGIRWIDRRPDAAYAALVHDRDGVVVAGFDVTIQGTGPTSEKVLVRRLAGPPAG